jgi:hypothetical protein
MDVVVELVRRWGVMGVIVMMVSLFHFEKYFILNG